MADSEGWIDSGDLVEIDRDRAHFLGRVAGAINVGGHKVLPEEVETKVLEVAGVVDCLVRGRRSGWTGSLVEAFVVPASESLSEVEIKDLARKVQRHCAARLPKFKVPALVRVVDRLELASAGKKERPVEDDSSVHGRIRSRLSSPEHGKDTQ